MVLKEDWKAGFWKVWSKSQKSKAEQIKEKEREKCERGRRELEFSQVMLICRYIKKWEDLFRNIDFHIAGMILGIVCSLFPPDYGL